MVKVSDGDTITVLDLKKSQHKIRLSGIDAPEKGQPFGTASRAHLAEQIAGKNITVEYKKRDRYRRILGKIVLGTRDLNLEQIKAGFAWHYKHYQKDQSPDDRSAYAAAEEEARKTGRGLWQDKAPTPPWTFRKETKALAKKKKKSRQGAQ